MYVKTKSCCSLSSVCVYIFVCMHMCVYACVCVYKELACIKLFGANAIIYQNIFIVLDRVQLIKFYLFIFFTLECQGYCCCISRNYLLLTNVCVCNLLQ